MKPVLGAAPFAATLSLVMTFVLGAGAAGCPGEGEGEGEGDEGEGEGEGDATAEETADAFQGLITRCFADGFNGQAEPTLFALLLDEQGTELRAAFLAQLSDPDVEFDAAQARECIDVLDTLSCDELFNGGAEPPACVGVTTGTIALGDACAFEGECVPGLVCKGASGTECGACAQPAGDGEDCSDALCGDGLQCNGTTCEPQPPFVDTGDACDESTFVFCSRDGDVCVDDVCTTPDIVQVGEPCDQQLLHCIDTATHNVCLPDDAGGTFTCTARPDLNGDCSDFPLCDDTEATCEDGTCVAAGVDGETCDQAATQPCLAGLSCQQGTCVPAVEHFSAFPTCD